MKPSRRILFFTAAALLALSVPLHMGAFPMAQYMGATEYLTGIFSRPPPAKAALSPDGKQIVLVYHSQFQGTQLILLDVDDPVKSQKILKIDSNKSSVGISWLGWITPEKFVFELDGSRYGPDLHINPYLTNRESAGKRNVIMIYDTQIGVSHSLFNIRDVSELRPAEVPFFPDYDFSSYNWNRPFQGSIWHNPASYYSRPYRIPPPRYIIPYAIRILGLAPGEAGTILIQTRSTDYLRIYACNVNGRKPQRRHTNSIYDYSEKWDDVLTDLEGTPKISVKKNDEQYYYKHIRKFWFDQKLDNPAAEIIGTGFSASAETHFGERKIPIGFGTDPNILYYASNTNRNTYGIYSFDIKSGAPSDFAAEDADYDMIDIPSSAYMNDRVLIIDRHTGQLAGIRYQTLRRTTRWLDSRMAEIQKRIDEIFPGYAMEIQEWDSNKRNVLFLASGPSASARYYCINMDTDRVIDLSFVQATTNPHPTQTFEFTNDNGVRISGILTIPQKATLGQNPVVVICPETPWSRTPVDFTPEVQAFADFGYSVLQVNARGAAGFGIKHIQAIKNGYENAQLEDIMAAISHLAGKSQIDPSRIALFGDTHGGYIALRALQRHPGRFRCAVALQPTLDPAGNLPQMASAFPYKGATAMVMKNFIGDMQNIKESPLLRQPAEIKAPVCLLVFNNTQMPSAYNKIRQFTAALKQNNIPVMFLDFVHNTPRAKAAVFLNFKKFLDSNMGKSAPPY